MPPPPKKLPGEESIQLNRTFDTVDEMNAYVSSQMPGYRVSKFWNVIHIHCVVTGKSALKENPKTAPKKVVEAQVKIEAAKKTKGPPPPSLKSMGLKADFKSQPDLL